LGCDAKVGRGVVSTASAERGAERVALDRCDVTHSQNFFQINILDFSRRYPSYYTLRPRTHLTKTPGYLALRPSDTP
jgi:hypothetical protein